MNKVINVDVTKKNQFHNFLQSFRSKLLSSNEWNYFLPNDINKYRLVNLVVSFLKSEDCAVRNKLCFINRCFIIRETFHGICIVNEDLSLTYRKANQIIPFHVVFAGSSPNEVIRVIYDDTGINISLLFISNDVSSSLFFREGKSSDRSGI